MASEYVGLLIDLLPSVSEAAILGHWGMLAVLGSKDHLL